MSKLNLLELRHSREMWKEVNIDALANKDKELYVNRKKAVDLYIDGVSPKKIIECTGIAGCEITRLVRRCIIKDNTGIEKGYLALIPNLKAKETNDKLTQLFLEHPTLESFISGNYFGDRKYTLEHNMNVRTLHTKFIEECLRLGIQNYEYPFTIKDKGYLTLYRYIKKLELIKQKQAIKRQNNDAVQKFESTGYGEKYNLNPIHPYEVVQIDGHKIDLLYVVEVENEQGEIITMPATRCWLLAIIDVATRAIIGYSVSPYENYNQYDILTAVQNSIMPHKKIEFSHRSLKYPDNGGFPSSAIPDTEWASFDMLMLDNAKSHLAQNTVDKLVNNVQCAVNFGSVATPETRGIIERFFKTLETQGFHRLPATTGSNSQDNKRKNPEKNAIKYNITFNDICELLEYFIAEYNNSAHSALEYQTPLQVMERRIYQAGMKPYIIPVDKRTDFNKLTYFTVERTLRGGYKTGTKPQISYMGVKYHAYDTMIPMDYVGEKVYIEVNPQDVSHVDLYDKKGIFIANLVAMGEWGRKPHSIKTHQAVLKRKNKNLETNTIFTPHLTEYEKELRENSKKSRRDRTNASIVRNEMNMSLNKENKSGTLIKYTKSNTTTEKNVLSKDEIELIDSMSIEEAYMKGLI